NRAYAVLGDMLELGPQSGPLHEEIGSLLADIQPAHIFLKGSLTGFLAVGAIRRGFPKEEITFFENPEDVVALLNSRLNPSDWILVKGSRKMKMEAVAEKIIEAFDLKPQTL